MNIEQPPSTSSRERPARNTQMEEALFAWFLNAHQKDVSLTDDMLKRKAKTFGDALGVSDDFAYSSGWLSNFKKRRNISMVTLHGKC